MPGEAGEDGPIGLVQVQADAGPPISAETTWRGRALQAEEARRALEDELSKIRGELERAKVEAESARRTREIESAVAAAGAIDVEIASLLADAALKREPDKPLSVIIAELKRRKPSVFRPAGDAGAGSGIGGGGGGGVGGGGGGGAMGASPREQPPDAALAGLLDEARRSGDRKALLRYLRARRGE